MTLERILKAAVNSMITGHHSAHCYHAHIPGEGYVNDGSRTDLRPEYLRQLARAASSEIANMGFARTYVEPGYEQPKRGILFANWNRLPRNLDRILERAGYAVEWSDEWTTCEDCDRAFRTQPDGYCWEPAGDYCEQCSAELCHDCHTNRHEDDGGNDK